MSVLGFDFDSTLVRAFTAIPLPGVAQRIAALPSDQRIFVATNQAGPVYRAITGDAKYPTAAQVARQLVDGLDAVGLLSRQGLLIMVATAAPQLPDSGSDAELEASKLEEAFSQLAPQLAMLATGHPGWRKPEPGMLRYAARFFLLHLPAPSELLFVGDMESDRQAAEAAGAQYCDAAAWVRGESP